MAETDAWERDLQEERRQKDDFMARHPESPFISARVPFHELRYFPPDPAYRVRARIIRVVTPQEAYLRTNRDGQSVMRYIGDLVFSLKGRELRLRVFHAGEGVGAHVFVPFRDSTSGKESYGPGRYLTLELNPNDSYDLDFNRAFNPYCAYTDDYECGFPPAENDLPVAIRAGERAWEADRNPATPSTLVKERTAKALGQRPPTPPSKPRTAARELPKRAVAKPSRLTPKSKPKPKPKPAARSAPAAKKSAKGGGKARGSPSPRTARPPRRAAARGRASSPSRRRGR
jgi:uncharacterized protein